MTNTFIDKNKSSYTKNIEKSGGKNIESDNSKNKLWKIKLDDEEERVCGIKRGYKSKNLKNKKDFQELTEHKYVDKNLHNNLVKSDNQTKVNQDYFIIIEKDELKEQLRDKNLYNSEHDLKHTSLANSCESYATGKKIIGINKLENEPSTISRGEEFIIDKDNKDIFNNTDLVINYDENTNTLQSNKKCHDPYNKFKRSETLLTHSEIKKLGRIYNISIKGLKSDICNRLYQKALRFQDDLNENHSDDLKIEEENKKDTCYQLKKKQCNNINNDCDYLYETKNDLKERLMLLDLLNNTTNNYDNLLKSDIIKKLKEYSNNYNQDTEKSYIIKPNTYSRCIKNTKKKYIIYHKKFIRNLNNKINQLKEKNLLEQFNNYIKDNRLLKKNTKAINNNYNIILKYKFSKNLEEQNIQIKNINIIVEYINQLLPDSPLNFYNLDNIDDASSDNTDEENLDNNDMTSEDNTIETSEDNTIETSEDNTIEISKDNIIDNTSEDNTIETSEDNTIETSEDNTIEISEDNIIDNTSENNTDTSEDNIDEQNLDNTSDTSEDNIDELNLDSISETSEDNIDEENLDNNDMTSEDNIDEQNLDSNDMTSEDNIDEENLDNNDMTSEDNIDEENLDSNDMTSEDNIDEKNLDNNDMTNEDNIDEENLDSNDATSEDNTDNKAKDENGEENKDNIDEQNLDSTDMTSEDNTNDISEDNTTDINEDNTNNINDNDDDDDEEDSDDEDSDDGDSDDDSDDEGLLMSDDINITNIDSSDEGEISIDDEENIILKNPIDYKKNELNDIKFIL